MYQCYSMYVDWITPVIRMLARKIDVFHHSCNFGGLLEMIDMVVSFPTASIVSTPHNLIQHLVSLSTLTPVVEPWYSALLLSELSYSQLQRFPCCWLCHRLLVNCHPIDWLVPVPVHALQYASKRAAETCAPDQ